VLTIIQRKSKATLIWVLLPAVNGLLTFSAVIRLVLFDIDGTLIHTGGAGVKAFAKVFRTEFGATDHFERLKFAGRTDVSLVREFFSFHHIAATPENFKRFFGRYVFWLDHILRDSKTEVCPGVWEFIRQLGELGPAPLLGLLTGNIRLGAEIKLRHFNLWDVFAVGAFADDHEERDKIASIARQRGALLLGEALGDHQVLVIGDTPLDIRCGKAIGAKVLAVATGGTGIDELKQHQADWVAPDLNAITAKELILP
jgi:phosphoglycolate phosphatase-like HAD superfamily hydrolase